MQTHGHGNDQIHIRLEGDVISRLAGWCQDIQLSCSAVDGHVHEAVEGNGYSILCDTPGLYSFSQVAKASAMRFIVAVQDPEHLGATSANGQSIR